MKKILGLKNDQIEKEGRIHLSQKDTLPLKSDFADEKSTLNTKSQIKPNF